MRVQLDISNDADCSFLERYPKEKRGDILRNCISIGRIAIENSSITINDSKHLEPFIEKFREITNEQVSKTLETIKETVEKIEESRESIDIMSKYITNEVKKNSDTMVDCIRSQSSMTEKIIDPITSRIDKMNTEVEKIFSIKSSSNTKGKFGEAIIESHISTIFPHYQITNMSQFGHEGDYQIDTENGKILLEVKTYSNSVPKDQIEKLYKDIDRTGVPCAILLSTTSGIVGKKHIEWEIYGKNKCIVLFFPNSTLGQEAVVFSFLFMKALIELGVNKVSHDSIIKSNEEILEVLKMFDGFYKNLIELTEKQSKLRYQISTIKTAINKSMDDLYKQCFELELEHKQTIQSIYSSLKEKMVNYNFSIEKYSILDNSLDFEKILRMLNIKENQMKAMRKVFSIIEECPNLKLYHEIETNKLVVINNDNENKLVFTFNIQKTKIELVFDIPKDISSLTFNPKFETIKNNQILINLENETDNLEFISQKLKAL